MAESEVKLTVGEEKVRTEDVTKGVTLDLQHRDPEHLHDYIKVLACDARVNDIHLLLLLLLLSKSVRLWSYFDAIRQFCCRPIFERSGDLSWMIFSYFLRVFL